MSVLWSIMPVDKFLTKLVSHLLIPLRLLVRLSFSLPLWAIVEANKNLARVLVNTYASRGCSQRFVIEDFAFRALP